MSAIKERLLFLRSFLDDRDVAYLLPTFPPGIRKVCEKMDLSKRRVIIEYGPGTGVFTREFLPRLTPDSKVILIEKNPTLVAFLQEHVADPRVQTFQESAENARSVLAACGEEKADYILSGIPFSYLPREVARGIVRMTKEILTEEGAFLVYQVRPKVEEYLREAFPVIRKDFEFWNLPPLYIYEARK
jgi:phospholipid N-methyltransferase